MASEYKYLGLGLAGGMGLAALLISGMVVLETGFSTNPPSPTKTQIGITPAPSRSPLSTPTFTPTSLATITPQPTLFLSPTPTLTGIELMLAEGELFLTGGLPQEQQIRLYESSLKYLARSPQESLLMARSINGVEYGDAGSICGPLAIAMMRDAAMVDPQVIPHDFWLLNPWVKEDRQFLNETLSPDKYDYFVFYDWLIDFDWNAFPLKPGDFLYIHAGGGGNFDHMLVVNRVDSQLRAYSVTNYQRPDGFVIDEVLLYDPADPDAGILHAWAARALAPSGSTGFGGFELWRPTFTESEE